MTRLRTPDDSVLSPHKSEEPVVATLGRRQLLQGAAAVGVIGASRTLAPGWMPRLAFRSPGMLANGGPGDVLVSIFLRGGMDGLSAVTPFGEGANYYDRRPTVAVPEPGRVNGALDLDGFFGFHPALAPLKDLFDDKRVAVVHATGSVDPTRSHFDAMHFMELGTPGVKTTTTGWIGRHLQSVAWQNDSPFRAVGMGAILPESLRGGVAPLSIRSIADFHFKGREDELKKLQAQLAALYTINAPADLLSRQAGLVFETVATLNKLDLDRYQPSNGASYPGDEFGEGLRQIAQLVKADLGLEVACLDLGGWDTHEQQGTLDGTFNGLLTTLARGLGAFYADLDQHMGKVTVVVMSEFGRRVGENGSSGTDHGHGNVMLIMGGSIHGGKVYHRWPTLRPEKLDDGDLAITTDYREVLTELLTRRLNNPALDQVFPGFSATPLGIFQPRA